MGLFRFGVFNRLRPRRAIVCALPLALGLLWAAAPVAAGPPSPQGDLQVQDGHVLVAHPAPSVDAVSATTALPGTWDWFFVLDDVDVAVTNPTLTVDSGYPVSAFPSLIATSFPVTVSQASLGAGETWFPNAQFGVTTIPTTVTPGFDSTRTVTPAMVPAGGGTQEIAVTVTPRTTGPDYKVSVDDAPGTSVTTVSGPSNLDQGEVVGELPDEFDLENAVAGKTYTFTFSDQVPNPYGVPLAHKPFVFVNGGGQTADSCCSGPSTSIDFADPTLDGGTPGRGHVTFSVDQTVDRWEVLNGAFTEVEYGALETAPAIPPPTLAVSPTTIVRGQSSFTASGTAEPGGTISLLIDGATPEATGIPVDATGDWSFTGSAIVGAHMLTAEERILAATSDASTPVAIDVLPPAPAITRPATVTSTGAPASFTLQGNGFYGSAQNPPAGSMVTVLDGSTPLGSAVVNPAGGWSMPVQLEAGSDTLTATQTLAGETSASSPPFTLTVQVTLQGLESFLLTDHLPLGDLIDLEARLLAANVQLRLGRTNDACHSLSTFAQHAADDSTGHHPALSTAEAEILVADEKALAAGLGCQS